jgi:hypothetical protein
MPHSAHYRLDYVLNGSGKSFYVSTPTMSNAEEQVKVFSKPLAERHGIAEVRWTQA